MRKQLTLLALLCVFFSTIFFSCKNSSSRKLLIESIEPIEGENEEKEEMYDQPGEADRMEFERTKDPALGYIPANKLYNAIEYTERIKNSYAKARFGMLWNERGPIYDSVGPNGNSRGAGGFTSGRTRAVLIDTLNDITGNTVIMGGVAGGIWKCTNFLSPVPNWIHNSDFFDNLAISGICQDPTDPSIMYFSTGEPVASIDAVNGAGVWKSTDAGNTWSRLASTVNFIRTFKIQCDGAGNVYLAVRNTTVPVVLTGGVYRSNDKGATWTSITPTGLTSNSSCTDIEITSTGKLHAVFGYLGTIINHRYTNIPATATSTTGWNTGVIRKSSVGAERTEIAALGDILYALTVNLSDQIDSCYKSMDGGATWTLQNPTGYPTGLANGQGWYNITLAINPSNPEEIMMGGLDAYRSVNSGQTITKVTNWISAIPYVHADHHFMQWYNLNGESRILIGGDGGIYHSRNAGVTWQDRNKNLAIKQFYSGDIHPAAGSSYLLAGAQDNGTHVITTPGLTYSKEVYGGDGMLVRINQKNPLIQFTTNPGNSYRRSVDGGLSWASVGNYGGGLFINPWDYDDNKDVLWGALDVAVTGARVLRILNASTGTAAASLTLTQFGAGGPTVTGGTGAFPSAFKASPYIQDRMYIAGSFYNGSSGANATTKLVRIDNGTTAPIVTTLNTASFPTRAFLNCINVGSNDNMLVAVFSNYGVDNVWISTNGGTSWTAVDGNLPDMPVRWAVFVPGNDQRLMLATEAGVYTTDLLNGASTIWDPSAGFPTVRTDMLRMRTSDNTVVAATHGRGLFTAQFPETPAPSISFAAASTSVLEDNTGSLNCRTYKDYTVNLGILNPPTGNANVILNVQAGNTATPGVDFDFTTNGSFTTPSSQFVFPSGDVALRPVTVRIYDDAEVESTETFTLGFTIAGTTNAVAGSQATHTFSIFDNDKVPVPVPTSFVPVNNVVTFGSYNANLGTTTPFEGTKIKHRLQVLFTADEFKTLGLTSSIAINSITVRIVTKNTTKPFKGFTISIGHTSNAGLNNDFAPEGLSTVYSQDYSTMVGNNLFNFSTPFIWDGVSNVVVQFCFDNGPTPAEGVVDITEGHTNPLGGYRASIYSNAGGSSANAGCSLPASFISFFRMNASFATSTVVSGNPVAKNLNTPGTEYLNANNDLYYYTPSGEIITRIKNLSTHIYGCTQVTIDRAGTGASQFWNSNPANYLMNKTYKVVPTSNNITGRYEITFYYTKEEKEGWEAATGKSWNDIMLVKVPSVISNVTPLNAQPDGAGTVQIITPVRGTYGNGYTLTATIDNGFSGYSAGIPGRINTTLNLTGVLDNNLRDINLAWTTSAEMTTTVLELEKSYDGTKWNKISTVNAAGTKLTPTSYSHVDKEYVQLNYYRVKLVFSDGTFQYSNIFFAENNHVPQKVTIFGNPFTNDIRLRLSRAPDGPVYLSMFDMSGRLVLKYSEYSRFVLFTINTSKILSAGIYNLRVNIDGVVTWYPVLKQ